MDELKNFGFQQVKKNFEKIENISDITSLEEGINLYKDIICNFEHLVISINSDKDFVGLKKSKLGLLDIYLKKQEDDELSIEKIIENFNENDFSDEKKLSNFAISEKDFGEEKEIVKKYFEIISSLEEKIKNLLQKRENSGEKQKEKFEKLKRKKQGLYENNLISDLYSEYRGFDEEILNLVSETQESIFSKNIFPNISFGVNFLKNENLLKNIESALKENFLNGNFNFAGKLPISFLEKNIYLGDFEKLENGNISCSFNFQDWNLKIISENNFISFPIEFNEKGLIKKSKEKLLKVKIIIEKLAKFNLEYKKILDNSRIKFVIDSIKNNLIENPKEKDISFLDDFLWYLKLLLKDGKLEKIYDLLGKDGLTEFFKENNLDLDTLDSIEKLYNFILSLDIYSFKEKYFKGKLEFIHNNFDGKEYIVYFKEYTKIDFLGHLEGDYLIIDEATGLNENGKREEITLSLLEKNKVVDFFNSYIKRFLTKKLDIDHINTFSVSAYFTNGKLDFLYGNPFNKVLSYNDIREKVINKLKNNLEKNGFFILNKDNLGRIIEVKKDDMYFKINLKDSGIIIQKFVKEGGQFNKKIIEELNFIINNI